MKDLNNMPWQIQRILQVAHDLQHTGSTPASTGERIAAAFVLNRADYLPDSYSDIIAAWDRLDETWQAAVRLIKRDYSHLIDQGEGR